MRANPLHPSGHRLQPQPLFCSTLPLVHTNLGFITHVSRAVASPPLCSHADSGAGGAVVGFVSDRMGKRGIVCFVFLVLAVPSLFVYRDFGTTKAANSGLMFLAGEFAMQFDGRLGPTWVVCHAVALGRS